MKQTSVALAVMTVLGLSVAAHAQPAPPPAAAPPPPPPYGMPIDGDQAQKAMTAAEAEARQNHWALSLAVVDTNGNLVMFKMLPGAPPFTGQIAIRKAKTSAALRAPTKALAAMGPQLSQLLPELAPVEGAVPIISGGKVIGAIGGSGAASSQDAQAAARGAAAVQ